MLIIFAVVSCTKESPSSGGTGSGGSGGSGGGTTPSALPARSAIDTPYGTDAKQRMDIYLPAGRNARTRVIVLIHGGGWQAGDKSEYTYFKNYLAAKWPDVAYVNINYRLASNTANIHYAEIMSDIKSAINFIVANKNNFVVSDTFGIVGESAGGHLAMLYAYTQNTGNYVKCVGDMYGPAKLDDWSWYNSTLLNGMQVSSLISTYAGATYNTTLYQSLSPYSTASSTSPPTILFHGTLDPVVPLYQSQWMKGKLVSLGVQHEYYEYLDFHGFTSGNVSDCATKMVTFFKKYM